MASYHYDTIARAIHYLQENFEAQPSLEELAAHVHMSPHHFQKVFTEWAGVSPKQFLRFINISYAKYLFKEDRQATLFDVAASAGLSSTSRLHDSFVSIEAMTPAEYKNGGAGLVIHYSMADTLFGKAIAASTTKGLCYLAFECEEPLEERLRHLFPNAEFVQATDPQHTKAFAYLNGERNFSGPLHLHLRGTDFQLKVWEALLRIPETAFKTYGSLAKEVGSDKASRAVGGAVGANPVAYLIPCHRVIQQSGIIGGYRWGPLRKAIMLGRELAAAEA